MRDCSTILTECKGSSKASAAGPNQRLPSHASDRVFNIYLKILERMMREVWK